MTLPIGTRISTYLAESRVGGPWIWIRGNGGDRTSRAVADFWGFISRHYFISALVFGAGAVTYLLALRYVCPVKKTAIKTEEEAVLKIENEQAEDSNPPPPATDANQPPPPPAAAVGITQ